MAKKRKLKMEFRYYQMQDGSPILALLGEKWEQNYGRDVDYLHFHNYLEIGFCYSGEGELVLGEGNLLLFRQIFPTLPPVMWEISASGNICLLMWRDSLRWRQELLCVRRKWFSVFIQKHCA